MTRVHFGSVTSVVLQNEDWESLWNMWLVGCWVGGSPVSWHCVCVGMRVGRGCKYVGVNGERRRRKGRGVCVCVCAVDMRRTLSFCSLVLTSVAGWGSVLSHWL